jgi:hypothetical protein
MLSDGMQAITSDGLLSHENNLYQHLMFIG